jgi:hypothetical protein
MYFPVTELASVTDIETDTSKSVVFAKLQPIIVNLLAAPGTKTLTGVVPMSFDTLVLK